MPTFLQAPELSYPVLHQALATDGARTLTGTLMHVQPGAVRHTLMDGGQTVRPHREREPQIFKKKINLPFPWLELTIFHSRVMVGQVATQ